MFSTDNKRITVLTQGNTDRTPSAAVENLPSATPATQPDDEVLDDRTEIATGDNTLLIVEDDFTFATVLRDAAREHGLKCIVARTGENALQLASQYTPSAITLDIHLPDISGWAILDNLKSDLNTRHIPVTVLSATAPVPEAMAKYYGAFVQETKPSSKEGLEEMFAHLARFNRSTRHRLLMVSLSEAERAEIADMLKGDDIEIIAVTGRDAALETLQSSPVACVVLPWHAGRPNGAVEMLQLLGGDAVFAEMPVVLKTDGPVDGDEAGDFKQHAGPLNVRLAATAEALFAETALFLHRDVRDMTPEQREILLRHSRSAGDLKGLKVLIVDDDIRNIFALTSLLEDQGLRVISKDSGVAAIELLQQSSDIAVVLMDMMMPEVDGYETIRRLRNEERFKTLPIVALTAKAMKGDREKCIAAGASDYLSKPVNTEQLLTTLRIWSR